MKNYLLPVLLLTSFFAFETNAENKIPVEHFWCESAMNNGTLSPNGKYFAAMVPATGPNCSISDEEEGQSPRVLLVIDLETNTPNVLSGTRSGSKIVWFQWISNSRIAFYRDAQTGLDAYSL